MRHFIFGIAMLAGGCLITSLVADYMQARAMASSFPTVSFEPPRQFSGR